jgi:carboxylate-amine ligase
MEFIDDVVDELGSRRAVSYIDTLLAEGTSADRQLRVFGDKGDMRAVVDHVAGETLEFSRARDRQSA